MNRSRGAGQPPAARFSSQWDLPGPPKQFPASPDTGQGAMELLQAMTGPRFVSKDLEAVRDPEIAGVWLVLDRANKKGHIVYVNDQDFETVDSYEDAEKEYQRAARQGSPVTYVEAADPIESAIDAVLEFKKKRIMAPYHTWSERGVYAFTHNGEEYTASTLPLLRLIAGKMGIELYPYEG